MIIRRVADLKNTDRDVTTESKWNSIRLLIKSDNMGFSLHYTTIFAGTELPTHYENYLEAVYCVSGEGEIHFNEGRNVQAVLPGTMYALDQHDRHVLRAHSDLHLICVFNPPVKGHEKHNATGGYDA